MSAADDRHGVNVHREAGILQEKLLDRIGDALDRDEREIALNLHRQATDLLEARVADDVPTLARMLDEEDDRALGD